MSRTTESAIRSTAALCAALDDATSASQVLQRALPLLRGVLGDRVALDLRTSTAPSATSGGLAVPLVARGRCFGELRAEGYELDEASGRAFASAAGRIIGVALLLQEERRPRPDDALGSPVEHRLRSALATIGVAASTLQARREHLAPPVQDRLLADIEANVASLRATIDELTLSGEEIHRGA